MTLGKGPETEPGTAIATSATVARLIRVQDGNGHRRLHSDDRGLAEQDRPARTLEGPPNIETAASLVLGETSLPIVKKRIVDNVAVAVKICRRPNIPGAAVTWQREAVILQGLGRHASTRHMSFRGS